ncbi:hypothetical protein D9619_010734 [Psilocybe cf. subviscida]|uniref:Uncharacterized protein n=1 Tax=Psilocybe cf. subviscida TaxID=2480587 RepID=A0A8H5F003_9AGAR|nr:hypothetical protein D9619_010734 [Psilocybe cf. subviscida]
MRSLHAWSIIVVFFFAWLPHFAFAAALRDFLPCIVEAERGDCNATTTAGGMVGRFEKNYRGAGRPTARAIIRVGRDDPSPTTSATYPSASSTDSPEKKSLMHQGLVAILGLVAVIIGIIVLLCLFHVAGRSMSF